VSFLATVRLTQAGPSLLSRRLYQVFGFACGFVLIAYGFDAASVGLRGAGTFTSQFLGTNLLVGGSALIFVSLYYLLKPVTPGPAQVSPPTGPRPDVAMELVVEEQTPPKPGFYKKIEYVGYFFALLGLVSAADLVMQVFLRSTYNEARWWVEVLLVTFGVLSYTILGSVGRLGSQEEAKLANVPAEPAVKPQPQQVAVSTTAATVAPVAVAEAMETLTLRVSDFTRNSEGEYEKHISGESYDMFRVSHEMVIVWREDRHGMRSTYLAGPYELSERMLEEYEKSGQELRIGELVLPSDEIRGLLQLTKISKE